MDIENFVQNIKSYCELRDVKPTVACREAGVGGSFINNMESRGSVPSVEKVQMLAHYLGVTVSELLGESNTTALSDLNTGPPSELTLHDSAVRLTVAEVELVLAYRRADDRTKTMIHLALEPYEKKGKTTSVG